MTALPRVRPSRRLASPGFTLVELVISSSLMALILTSAYLCLHGAVSAQRLIEPRLEALQTARVVLARMSADLRCACSRPRSQDDFLGSHQTFGDLDSDSIDFATHNYTPRRPREGDYCAVSFFLQRNPQSGRFGLWRRSSPNISPDALEGGTGGLREELAQGVAALRFEYSDGYDWYDTWGDVEGRGKAETSARYHPNLSGMPDAVRITLSLEAGTTNEPPMVFQTVARLNLAPALEAKLSSSSSSDQNSNPSQGPNPGPNP